MRAAVFAAGAILMAAHIVPRGAPVSFWLGFGLVVASLASLFNRDSRGK